MILLLNPMMDPESSLLVLVLRAEPEASTVVGLALPSSPVLDLVPAEVRTALHDLDVPHTVRLPTPKRAGKERGRPSYAVSSRRKSW